MLARSVAFGTDCPVEPPEPMRGIHAAVTRQLPGGDPPGGWYPEQRVTVAEAIHAYTAASAEALGRGAELGMLAPGRLADAVVLSADPYTTDPAIPCGYIRAGHDLRRPDRLPGRPDATCRHLSASPLMATAQQPLRLPLSRARERGSGAMGIRGPVVE